MASNESNLGLRCLLPLFRGGSMVKNFKWIRSMVFCAAIATLAVVSLPALAAGSVTIPLAGIHAQVKPPIYPHHMDPKAQIHEALLTAAMQHRRVLVNFGTNSCGSCRLLNTYLHESRNFYLLKYNYVLVYVNVGPGFHQHADIAKDYGLNLTQGVPTLAVLDRPGHMVGSAQFPNLRKQGSAPVTAFLKKWKPAPATAP